MECIDMAKSKKAKVFYLFAVLAVGALLFSGANAQAVSEEARRHLIRGQAAVEAAKSSNDYKDAIAEYDLARKLAPDWPDPFFNLGMVHTAAGNHDEAITNFRKYLDLSPSAGDASQVKDQIYRLEYLRERSNLEGIWTMDRNEIDVNCDPRGIALTGRGALGSTIFMIEDVRLEILKRPSGYEARVLSSKGRFGTLMSIPDGSFVALQRNGESVKIFDALMHTCSARLATDQCPWKAKFILRQVSTNTMQGAIETRGVAYNVRSLEPMGIGCNGKIVLRRNDKAR